MYNAFTVDVEDYYMVSAFADVVKFEDWPGHESRVEKNINTILGLLSDHGVKATFFTLGWIAEHFPEIVRAIHAEGHEVACHGYNHRLIYDLSPEEFREDVHRAKMLLEDITGTQVIGYRAASYSIVEKTLWALDVLLEEGFLYDSSIFPIHHDRYGVPNAERFRNVIARGKGLITEFPASTYRIFGQNFPVCGGGYLRLLPLGIIKAAIRTINNRENEPAVIYMHPWEIDPGQPRIQANFRSCARHYLNLKTTLPKLKGLMNEFKFKPLSEFLT